MNHSLKSLMFVPADDSESPIEARRCGLFEDLFATEDGKIYRLEEMTQHRHNGSLAIRYDRANLMAVHAVADAWIPDWESMGTQIVPIDGNRLNLRLDNLTITGDPRRGRPRSNKNWLRLKARQLFAYCGDKEAVAEALHIGVRDVDLALREKR